MWLEAGVGLEGTVSQEELQFWSALACALLQKPRALMLAVSFSGGQHSFIVRVSLFFQVGGGGEEGRG